MRLVEDLTDEEDEVLRLIIAERLQSERPIWLYRLVGAIICFSPIYGFFFIKYAWPILKQWLLLALLW